MIIGTLVYQNVGRSKANGKVNIVADDEEDFNNKLLGVFGRFLMSSNIGFENGKIYAGGRHVGTFQFITQKLEAVA